MNNTSLQSPLSSPSFPPLPELGGREGAPRKYSIIIPYDLMNRCESYQLLLISWTAWVLVFSDVQDFHFKPRE